MDRPPVAASKGSRASRLHTPTGRGAPAVIPPSMGMAAPVMNEASSLARKVTSLATSEGSPPRLTFLADSDAHIVRGLIAILLTLYEDRPAQEILDLDAASTIARLDLAQHLSPNRANGLFAMIGRIRAFAAEALADAPH